MRTEGTICGHTTEVGESDAPNARSSPHNTPLKLRRAAVGDVRRPAPISEEALREDHTPGCGVDFAPLPGRCLRRRALARRPRCYACEHRRSAVKSEFKRANPCPGTGHSGGPCAGYVIDHINPLKRGGSDVPSNMQWQTKEAAEAKDRWE